MRTTDPKIVKVKEPDCCANCSHLKLGHDYGWDDCDKNGIIIAWSSRRIQKCESHHRSDKQDQRII
jgi:hypothetical protein